jgi:hypothetical protein
MNGAFRHRVEAIAASFLWLMGALSLESRAAHGAAFTVFAVWLAFGVGAVVWVALA